MADGDVDHNDRLNRSVTSMMEYSRECSAGIVWRETRQVPIEPLAGILRHPAVCPAYYEKQFKKRRVPKADRPFVYTKSYLIIDTWTIHRNRVPGKPTRGFFFDVGASLWSAGNGGSSQNWFEHVYRRHCLSFAQGGLYLYEAKPCPTLPNSSCTQDAIRSIVPSVLLPTYHYHHVFVTAEPGAASNPWTTLLAVAQPEDYVVVKVDFDTYHIEEGLVLQLLEDRRLSSLVDEFYFEHHVNMDVMKDHWDNYQSRNYQNTSIVIFRQLRERGIRAHSWV